MMWSITVVPGQFKQHLNMEGHYDHLRNMGFGPKGIGVNKITKQNLGPKILDLFHNQSYKEKKLQVSKEIKRILAIDYVKLL